MTMSKALSRGFHTYLDHLETRYPQNVVKSRCAGISDAEDGGGDLPSETEDALQVSHLQGAQRGGDPERSIRRGGRSERAAGSGHAVYLIEDR